MEGYVPIEVIEEKLFGTRLNRMHWSPYGSPLSCHTQGMPYHERSIRYPEYLNERQPLLKPHVGVLNTYPVHAIDPMEGCTECADRPTCIYHETVTSVQEKSHSPMDRMKVFTLINTFDMSATCAADFASANKYGGNEGASCETTAELGRCLKI